VTGIRPRSTKSRRLEPAINERGQYRIAANFGVPSHSCKVRVDPSHHGDPGIGHFDDDHCTRGTGGWCATTSNGLEGLLSALDGDHRVRPRTCRLGGGKVWVIGSSRPESFNHCIIESVVPTTLRTRRYSLAACGAYFAIGGGAIYLAAISYERGTNNDLVHIERFDPTTGHSTVMAPVVMTLVGSAPSPRRLCLRR
jgi:hypothetical protein